MSKLKSVMKHALGLVPTSSKPRSTFHIRSTHRTTGDAGYLIPILCREIYPGDDIDMTTTSVIRLNTPVVPFDSPLACDIHYFFEPHRLTWDNFQKFMGEKAKPTDHTDYVWPKITIPTGGFPAGTLGNYFGWNTKMAGQKVGALKFRGYNHIYNEYFRNQKLVDSLPFATGDTGSDDLADYKLRRRAKRKDYFTSCLPSPQEGPAVEVPILGSAPIITTSNRQVSGVQTPMKMAYSATGNLPNATQSMGVGTDGAVFPHGVASGTGTHLYPTNLVANLSAAGGAKVNDVRMAIQMQRIGEKLMRAGNRYVEQLLYRFGVKSPDARLQRPEFLGSETHWIQMSQVPQTSSSDAQTPQGNLSAYSYGLYHGKRRVKKAFVEHGYLYVIASIRSDQMYQQGIHREDLRNTVHDLYNPEYAHLGEQAVLNKEIYANTADGLDDQVFGYMPRYDELRYGHSIVTGKQNSTDPLPLDMWHLAPYFANRPLLNQSFIEENPPINRVIAVQNEPQFNLNFGFDIKWSRVMPLYADPGYMDHF